MIAKLDEHRPGPDYSDSTKRDLNKIVNSNSNTSETTAEWNQGTNRTAEIQLEKYFDGDEEWKNLPQGAKRRFGEQSDAWKGMRDDIKDKAPGLAKEGDNFFNKGNKIF
uniref:Uncharacterized protein n=1 Tax=Plectus sambesii TaxID=2011161 RepID=A0A914WIR5_9BILA